MKSYKEVNERTKPINASMFNLLFSKLDKQVVNKVITIKKLTTGIIKLLKQFQIIEVGVLPSLDVDTNTLNVSAGYVHDEEPEYQEMYFYIAYNPKDKFIIFDKAKWEYTKQLFSSALVHEFLHQSQYIARSDKDQRTRDNRSQAKIKDKQSIDYLSNPDEIEAFAVNAAAELKQFYGDKALAAIRNYKKIGLKQSPVFDSYLITFKDDSRVLKKFVKAVTFYLKK